MLLSRVHRATHLFWPHTLRNRMIFRRKNWKCIISVFNQTAPLLDGYSFHCFCWAGRRERSLGQRCTWLIQHFDLRSMYLLHPRASLCGRISEIYGGQNGSASLACSVSRSSDPLDWAKNLHLPEVYLPEKQPRFWLEDINQWGIHHIPWYTAITWCMVN